MRLLNLSKAAAKALREIQRSSPQQARAIAERITLLKEAPFPSGCKALSAGHKGFHRIRCGDYRVIYRVTDEEITIASIGHRREVYK